MHVYRKMPPLFHDHLFAAQQPLEVRSGSVCDFMRSPCTPPDAPADNPSYSKPLNEWLTGAKHCADIPILMKLLALGALPGVHTDRPEEAHLFVVPFLGGFIERVSPTMTQGLDRSQKAGSGIADKLFRHLPHLSNATADRHLFLLTNSCGGCLRGPCHRCATWQLPWHHFPGMTLAATLGPAWPLDAIPATRRPPPGRRWMKQIIIPPNIMEKEFHPPSYAPLCGFASHGGGGVGSGGSVCRPNTARGKELLVFYQGAHSFNGMRDSIMRELVNNVFPPRATASDGPRPGHAASRAAARAATTAATSTSTTAATSTATAAAATPSARTPCDCAIRPRCCVNSTSGVAFFHTRSHWHPVTPLGFRATIEWMQKSRFCVCPPGDVPYNKRYFTALLAGCVPVLFSFPSQIREERNWWKPRKGPGQRSIDPFYSQINHTELGVVFRADSEADVKGFVERLRSIPDAVVEAKQRAIERVRHLLLYDMSGSREDAFSAMLRQLVHHLGDLPVGPALAVPDRRRPFGPEP